MREGKLVSFEGANGVGKTFYIERLKEHYANNPNIVFHKQIMDDKHKGIQEQIFKILSSTGSRFFDMGLPMTETALLTAKMAHDNETVFSQAISQGKTIISDRNIDTVCVYQALMMAKKYGGDPLVHANRIFDAISYFCAIPAITFLFTGNIEAVISRAEKRNHDSYSASDNALLKAVSELYVRFAKKYKDRFRVIDTSKHSTQEALQILINEIDYISGVKSEQ